MSNILTTLHDDGILRLTLHRPDKLNALNRAMLKELDEQLAYAKRDNQVKGVLLTGEGKAFCAGADLQELAECDPLLGYEFACLGQQVFSHLETLSKPSIALINGVALGGGCELSQAATIRMATPSAKFGQPEVKVGLIPGYGGTQRLARLIGKGRAMALCLTGHMIDAITALEWGFVYEVVEPERLLTHGEQLLKQILQQAPLAVASIMDVIHRGIELPLQDALHLEALEFAKICATADQKEGVQAFLEKRPPHFKGV